LQLFYFSQKVRNQAEQILSGQLPFSIVFAKSYVEVFSKDATKRAALSALAEYLDIPRRPIACIGDGENDV
jgi:hydroxymethylpyrimidine pyrophosphatase-like HAD family hydrolase